MRGEGRVTTSCVGGSAVGYACKNVDLEGFLNLSDMGGAWSANDVWGWTDAGDGDKEYAVVGLDIGVAFVDISAPTNPRVRGVLRTHTLNSDWRDIKTYRDHAFVVSEAEGHGVQVYDMKGLRSAPIMNDGSPAQLTETAHHGSWNAHNIFINEDSGYAYVVGSAMCRAGLYMLDVRDPANPTFAGCFSDDGYTHDVQCVNYSSNDPDGTNYGDREICFASNEDSLTIVDVTDKTRPVQISKFCYTGASYTHQGWLTDDRRFFLLDDETDNIGATTTFVVNVANLAAPYLYDTHYGTSEAADHNQYVLNGFAYQANYHAGLRILDLGYVAEDGDDDGNGPDLTEVAYFDVYRPNDKFGYNGAWSVYPYYESGRVVVSSIEQGLFVLTPRLTTTDGDGRTHSSVADDLVPLRVTDVETSDVRRFFARNNDDDEVAIAVTVRDGAGRPVPAVKVTGLWGNVGPATTCFTNGDGRCSVTGKSRRGVAPFRVVNLSKNGYRYDKSANKGIVSDRRGIGKTVLDVDMTKNVVKKLVRAGLGSG